MLYLFAVYVYIYICYTENHPMCLGKCRRQHRGFEMQDESMKLNQSWMKAAGRIRRKDPFKLPIPAYTACICICITIDYIYIYTYACRHTCVHRFVTSPQPNTKKVLVLVVPGWSDVPWSSRRHAGPMDECFPIEHSPKASWNFCEILGKMRFSHEIWDLGIFYPVLGPNPAISCHSKYPLVI